MKESPYRIKEIREFLSQAGPGQAEDHLQEAVREIERLNEQIEHYDYAIREAAVTIAAGVGSKFARILCDEELAKYAVAVARKITLMCTPEVLANYYRIEKEKAEIAAKEKEDAV